MTFDDLRKTLRDKVAVITGASSGLGRATAFALASEGVRLVLTARRADRLQQVADDIEASAGEAVILAGDAADEAVAQQTVDLALSTFGGLDFLIHCAGQGLYKPLLDSTSVEYDQLMNTNMRSTFLFARAAARPMTAQRSGTIVLVSSVAGLRGAGNEAIYVASKFAQVGFAEAIEQELRPFGIKVCALCPGGMKTEFAVGHGRDAATVAQSRMMEPEDVAQSILFACMQPKGARIPQMVVRHMG